MLEEAKRTGKGNIVQLMNWKTLILLAVGAILLAFPSIAAATPQVVILRDDVTAQDKLSQYGISDIRVSHKYSHALQGFAADLDPMTAGMLAADPEVVMVAADQKRDFSAAGWTGTRYRGIGMDQAANGSITGSGSTPIENIPQISPRGLRRIGGPLSPTAKIDNIDQRVNTDIAVIDSGVQIDQPDLNVVGGCDCTGGNNYGDVEGHGTIVAGVLGAKDNQFGIVGVAPGSRIWSLRVLDETGYGDNSAVLCAIDWVTEHKETIDVVNMSIGDVGSDDGHCGESNGDVIHYAICKSVDQGVVYVAGAANDFMDAKDTIPAAYSEVITVSAMVDSDGLPGAKGGPDPCEGFADDSFAPFSNWGRAIDLAAPGVCIASTYMGSDVAVDSGTSFAAPFVSGAAALYLASDRGQRDMRDVNDSRRAEKVREELRDRRWVEKLPGDPDHRNEGILNVSKI